MIYYSQEMREGNKKMKKFSEVEMRKVKAHLKNHVGIVCGDVAIAFNANETCTAFAYWAGERSTFSWDAHDEIINFCELNRTM